MFSSLVPLYLAEIAPRHLLGPVMVSGIMTIHVASVLVSIIGYQEVLVTPTLWPLAVGESSSPLYHVLKGTSLLKTRVGRDMK